MKAWSASTRAYQDRMLMERKRIMAGHAGKCRVPGVTNGCGRFPREAFDRNARRYTANRYKLGLVRRSAPTAEGRSRVPPPITGGCDADDD